MATPHGNMSSKARLAMKCALEAYVSYPLAWRILFTGETPKSLNAQRIVAWAKSNGVKLPGEKPSKAETDAKLAEFEALLDSAEAKRR
jgi:hypothetical protein